MQVRREDTGALLREGNVFCSAKVARSATASISRFSGTIARCSWQVPRRLRGKRIAGTETVAYAGKSMTRSFSAKIK